MTDKKQQKKAQNLKGQVTMLDYEGSPVVTYSVGRAGGPGHEKLRDLDVPEKDAEGVKGGRVGGKMHLEDVSMGAHRPSKILNQDSEI